MGGNLAQRESHGKQCLLVCHWNTLTLTKLIKDRQDQGHGLAEALCLDGRTLLKRCK